MQILFIVNEQAVRVCGEAKIEGKLYSRESVVHLFISIIVQIIFVMKYLHFVLAKYESSFAPQPTSLVLACICQTEYIAAEKVEIHLFY